MSGNGYFYPDVGDKMTGETVERFGRTRWALEEAYVLSEFRKIIGSSDLTVDAGTGMGRLIPYLRSFSRKVIAIDRDPIRLSVAMKNFDFEDVFFAQGRIGDLSFITPRIAGVVNCSHVFQHIPHYEVLHGLAEFQRVLKVGGFLILLTTHSPEGDKYYLVKQEGSVEVSKEEFEKAAENPVEGVLPVRKFSVEGIVKLLKDFGFELVKKYYYHIMPGQYPGEFLEVLEKLPGNSVTPHEFHKLVEEPIVKEFTEHFERINGDEESARKNSIDIAFLFRRRE